MLVVRFSVQSASITFFRLCLLGAVAQLGERLICIQEVAGSIPTSSTNPSEGPHKFGSVGAILSARAAQS
jgi:hypothetical protein